MADDAAREIPVQIERPDEHTMIETVIAGDVGVRRITTLDDAGKFVDARYFVQVGNDPTISSKL